MNTNSEYRSGSGRTPRRPTPRNKLFDLVAPAWDLAAGWYGVRWALDGLALADAPLRILDLGGATGRVGARLHALGHEVAVVDPSGPMIRRAGAKQLAALQGRAQALPLPDRSFDRVLVLDAFHHMGELEEVAAEIHRVLRPGGRAVLVEPDPRTVIGAAIALGERWAGMGSTLLDAAALTRLFADEGLAVDIDRGVFHLRLVARRPEDAQSSSSSTNASRTSESR
jgi:demethylmenaquinone methyltransferase/2-methoxy-6-polyprenyl-1,4-benzoquinol methylase